MKNFYRRFNHKKYILVAMIIFVVVASTIAQCTITIPPLGSGYTTNTTVINNNDTTIPGYSTAYVWICAGDTVYDHSGEGGGGGPGTEGIFFLEQNATFIYDGGGAEYTIYAKAGAYYSSNNPNNWVYADSTATVKPGSAGGCCGAVYVLCPQMVFDYTNITPGTGCLANAPPPLAGFGANPLNVCAGNSVTFTDSSMDGPTGWKWTFEGGTPGSSSSQNPVIAYDTAGTFNVKLVVTNSSGSDSLTKTGYITVTALPNSGTISANPDTLCSGGASTLTVTGGTGSLQWQSSTGGGFTSIQNATDTFYNTSALAQNTEFRIIATNGICADTSAVRQVTVNPLPTPPVVSTSDIIICSGDSTLIISSGTYSSYHWNTGDTASFIYAYAAGSYYLTVTNVNGCVAVSNHKAISVYPVPSVSIIVQGDTLSSFGASSYQWYDYGQPIPGATSSEYIATQPGGYGLQVTDSNGCSAIANLSIAYGITGLIKNGSLSIYPDPFTNSLFVKEENASLIIQKITVYDLLGRIELNKEYINYPGELQSLDVSALQPGVYFVKISSNEGELVQPVIKQ